MGRSPVSWVFPLVQLDEDKDTVGGVGGGGEPKLELAFFLRKLRMFIPCSLRVWGIFPLDSLVSGGGSGG